MARAARDSMIPDTKSTALSTTEEITDKEADKYAATILAMKRH